jgi:hypothetical protein
MQDKAMSALAPWESESARANTNLRRRLSLPGNTLWPPLTSFIIRAGSVPRSGAALCLSAINQSLSNVFKREQSFAEVALAH